MVGGLLAVIGVVGLILDHEFAHGRALHGSTDLGVELNGWHNALHLTFGLIGLAACRRVGPSRAFAFTWGLVALVLAIWGFADARPAAGLIPLNTADDFLHMLDATGTLIAIFSLARFRDVDLPPTTSREGAI